MDATELLQAFRVVPVVVIDDPGAAPSLARSLVAGGLGVIEVTLRTESALESIEAIAAQVPEMLVGVGSIRQPQQLHAAIDAGATFAVSPGATPALMRAAQASNLPFVPGAATPSEMLSLLDQGYRLQKFFPAEAAGGLAMLKSVAGPIPEVRFMPTGGIDASKAGDYLALANVSGVGGSWIAPPGLIAAGDFDEIERLAASAVKL